MKNVILLGGSNSVKKNGLKDGLKNGLSDGYRLINLALGASSSLQNLYEVIRNEKILDSAELIISESNVNDFHNLNMLDNDLSLVELHVSLLYKTLSSQSSPVLILLLPLQTDKFHDSKLVNDIHRKYIGKYGFNFIDMEYEYNNISPDDFFYFDNLDHPPLQIMYRLGMNISSDISSFKKNCHESDDLEMVVINDFSPNGNVFDKENSVFKESCINISSSFILPDQYSEYTLLGFHSWSDDYSGLKIKMLGNTQVVKRVNSECQFHEFSKPINISNIVSFSSTDDVSTEKSQRVDDEQVNVKALNLIGLLAYNANFFQSDGETDFVNKGVKRNDLLTFLDEYTKLIKEYQCMKEQFELKNSFSKRLFKALRNGTLLSSLLKKLSGNI